MSTDYPDLLTPNDSVAHSWYRPNQPFVVALAGELDIATVEGLQVQFDEAIARNVSDLVIDLSGVTFMDASIVGLLARTRIRMEGMSRHLTLESPSRCALRILDICQLTGIQGFRIVGGRSPAVLSA